MKIAVTGSAGFIGAHIQAAYRALGHDIVEIDLRGKEPRDINDEGAMTALFAKEKPDIVNHHAGVIEVVKSIEDPQPTFRTNVMGTINLLRAAGKAGTVRQFIFPSSYTVYGDPDTLPADERTPLAPISPYGLSKLMAEDAIRFYGKLYGLHHTIFRYGNIYGPGQDGTGNVGIVAIFADKMRRGGRPTIFGDGSKTRDYVHIDDIVRLNVAALENADDVTVCAGSMRMIADDEAFGEIARHANYAERPMYAPHRDGEVRRIMLANAKAKELFGWQPKVAFETGVERYMRDANPPRTT